MPDLQLNDLLKKKGNKNKLSVLDLFSGCSYRTVNIIRK
jgi:hypothetical protein